MEYDKEYLPLSWLSQTDYCARRAAFLLNEQIWSENADTAKGRAEHEKAHTQRVERRGSQLKLYEYAVFSDLLGISGKCDCVEAERTEGGCMIPASDFPVSLYPIEYKHGSVREESSYQIQLCAQAMCLEEMYDTEIPEGAIFFISAHRRSTVQFTSELRKKVSDTSLLLHDIRDKLSVPQAAFSKKCNRCSLREYCMPKVKRTAEGYCRRLLDEAGEKGMS